MTYKFIAVINPKDKKYLELSLKGKGAQIVNEESPFDKYIHITIEVNNLDDIFYLGEEFSYNKIINRKNEL